MISGRGRTSGRGALRGARDHSVCRQGLAGGRLLDMYPSSPCHVRRPPSHDTVRPIRLACGGMTGWDTSDPPWSVILFY